MEKIKLQKIVKNLLDKLRKLIVHAWNGHLEMFSLPQPIEDARQFLFLRFNHIFISLLLKIRQSATLFTSFGSLFQHVVPLKTKDRCPVFNLLLGRIRSFLYRVFLL